MTCDYCIGRDSVVEEVCPERSNSHPFTCTRERGHEGLHVACARMEGDHEIYAWIGDETDNIVKPDRN